VKVAQALRHSLRSDTRKHPPAANSRKEGQGELRGKQYRSNRCEASAVCNDYHLRRREDRLIGL
jgi:hypothetical protein